MTAQGGKGGQVPVVTRFAPSPTGRLHLGHAYSAVLAHDLAVARGGRFLLRIEDIDATRSRPEHVDTILADLAWLGLRWEGPVFQSARLPLYAAALARLREAGSIYPCFCTRADVAAASLGAPHGVPHGAPHGSGAVYPGTCRGLREVDMAQPHCWRLDVTSAVASLDPATLRWHDATMGWIVANPVRHGDVIVARKDALVSYHLAVTVDDAAQGVSDVVRGADLFAATDIHRLVQALLGLPTPRYHHHALLVGPDGERLAKRHGSPTLAAMREGGADGLALANNLRRRVLSALPGGTGFDRAGA